MEVFKIIKQDNLIKGEIIDFSHDGKGVLKVDNFTIFAYGGLIGDIVEVKIEEIKRNYATGRVVRIIKPSKDRCQVDFQVDESKGAIPLIEYDYLKQLDWKQEKVRKDLERIAGLDNVQVEKTIGMDTPFRYRNHTQIPVGKQKGRLEIGFYEINSRNIVDMEGSIIQPKIGDEILQLIREWMKKFNISPYDRQKQKGLIRHIGIRTNKDGEAMVILVTSNHKLPNKKELIEELTKTNVVSIYQNINRKNWSVTYGKEYIKLYGQEKLTDYIGKFKFNLSPNSFFQVNRPQAEVLYNKVVEYLDLDQEDIVYDLYSGIGTISLFIANKVKKIYGIEMVKAAVEDAWENAELNGVDNVEFITGRAEKVFPALLRKGIEANKLILDPPRKGCEKEVLEAIIELESEKIAYVSCNPSTMARDVKYLVHNGYKVKEIQPVDLFPHTAHVETVVLMSRIEN
ncbi:MAG TPA: 23S rRNA (uracil(1939)-C(5))-methyltransferase RlmD [Tissierellaceae bacterium]|nr:23S rRNA (uracil(1939)-C(5))-methyltransferase RlmD [Tissierellaceae bacterium]